VPAVLTPFLAPLKILCKLSLIVNRSWT